MQDLGIYLVVGALLLILTYKPSAVIGAGITPSPRGITPAKPKPKPKPKLVSRFNPKTTYRPIRGKQTQQGSRTAPKPKQLTPAQQKAAVQKQKLTTAIGIAFQGWKKELAKYPNPTPAIKSRVTYRWASWLRATSNAIMKPTGLLNVATTTGQSEGLGTVPVGAIKMGLKINECGDDEKCKDDVIDETYSDTNTYYDAGQIKQKVDICQGDRQCLEDLRQLTNQVIEGRSETVTPGGNLSGGGLNTKDGATSLRVTIA